jgi:hypothetical protein
MAWYYYGGDTILSVHVGNGEVIAARPHSTIFVDPSAENSAAFKRLGRVLRRTGAPRDAVIHVPAQPIAGKIVVPANAFSDSFIEGSAAVASNEDTDLIKSLSSVEVVDDAQPSGIVSLSKRKRNQK